MASSDKRPSVKGKKRTSVRIVHEKKAASTVDASSAADFAGTLDRPTAKSPSPLSSTRDESDIVEPTQSEGLRIGARGSFATHSGPAAGAEPRIIPASPESGTVEQDEAEERGEEGGLAKSIRELLEKAKALTKKRSSSDGQDASSDEGDVPSSGEESDSGLLSPRDAAGQGDSSLPAYSDGSFQDAAAEGEPEGQSTSRKATEKEKAIVRDRKRKKVLVVGASVLAIVALAGGLLLWNAYFRYDDASDIKGEWQVVDNGMTVVIDDEFIRMPESLSYAYDIDAWKKTVAFSFEDLKGSGSYKFMDGRKTLVIEEGEGENALSLRLTKVSDNAAAQPYKPESPSEDEEAGEADAEDGGMEQGEQVDGSAAEDVGADGR